MSESAGGSGRGKQRRKRHHYLPESYLKVWADEAGQVAVRRRDRTATFCTTTRNVAVEADLYALPPPKAPTTHGKWPCRKSRAICRDTSPPYETGPPRAKEPRRGMR
jgi:Protein of unknown function (DUF4238)